MKIAKLDDMIKGWFIGNFEPSLCKTNDVEVAVKKYNKGDFEDKHYHKIATEYTLIISGRVRMNNKEYKTCFYFINKILYYFNIYFFVIFCLYYRINDTIY